MLSLSHDLYCSGSFVVLDCIDSCSLPSFLLCKAVIKCKQPRVIRELNRSSEFDHEMQQSQTTDHPMAPRERDTEYRTVSLSYTLAYCHMRTQKEVEPGL